MRDGRYEEYGWGCMKRIQRVTGCGGQRKRDWDSETRKVMTAGIQTGVLNLTASSQCMSLCVFLPQCMCVTERTRMLGVDMKSETTVAFVCPYIKHDMVGLFSCSTLVHP